MNILFGNLDLDMHSAMPVQPFVNSKRTPIAGSEVKKKKEFRKI